MNNITFIFGNGFDISLGLNTRYIDFYPYFIEKFPNNYIARLIRKDIIKNNLDTWADLELSLGASTSKIPVEEYDRFYEDKLDLDECLIEYLKLEFNKCTLTKDQYNEIRNNLLRKIKDGNTLEETKLIQAFFNKHLSHQHLYNMINFNYTFCADNLFLENEFSSSHTDINNTVYKDSFQKKIHIHGDLNNKEAIIGVNDESQIPNDSLLQNTDIYSDFIKTEINKFLGNDKITDSKEMIEQSFLICLYGVSLGKTDQYWWDILGEWLQRDATRMLIVFMHKTKEELPNKFSTTKTVELKTINKFKTEVLKRLNIENTFVDSIRNKVVIHVNDEICNDEILKKYEDAAI